MSILNSILASSFGSANNIIYISNQNELDSLNIEANKTYLFKSGETFQKASILLDQNNVTVGSYGTGNKPIINGLNSISGFVDEGGGIYSKVITDTIHRIYINGIYAKEAMTDYKQISGDPDGNNTLTVVDSVYFNAFTDLSGAKMRIFEQNFRMSFDYIVSSYASGVFTVDKEFKATLPNKYLFLTGNQEFLTEDNTWFYNSGNNTLYIKLASNPTNYTLEYCSSDIGFSVSGNNCNVSDVKLNGFEIASIYGYGNYMTFNNIEISNNYGNGILTKNNILETRIQNSTFKDIGKNAITLGPSNGDIISGNTITDICVGPVIGIPYTDDIDLSYVGGVANYYGTTHDRFRIVGAGVQANWNFDQLRTIPINITIENNTISNTGYTAIDVRGNDHVIQNNEINGYCNVWEDGGGIHTYAGLQANLPGTECDNALVDTNEINYVSRDSNWSFIGSSTVAAMYLDVDTKNSTWQNNFGINNPLNLKQTLVGPGNTFSNNVWT